MSDEEALTLVETLERIVSDSTNKIQEMIQNDPIR
jgi:hypothetical protein